MYLVALYGVDEWITNPSQLELNSSLWQIVAAKVVTRTEVSHLL